MNEQTKIQLKEKTIEDLAMAITHSEQGVYSKNEKFVKEKIDELLKSQRDNLVEKIENTLIPYEITSSSNPRWVYNKAKQDIIFLIKEDNI